jgi:hypothetical protein
MMSPDVIELLNYNDGVQYTHMGEPKTRTLYTRPALCGRWYEQTAKKRMVIDDLRGVDCPSCLRVFKEKP